MNGLKRRIQKLEDRVNPEKSTITIVKCQIRIKEHEEDLKKIKDQFEAEYGPTEGLVIFLASRFLRPGDEEQPGIIWVRTEQTR